MAGVGPEFRDQGLHRRGVVDTSIAAEYRAACDELAFAVDLERADGRLLFDLLAGPVARHAHPDVRARAADALLDQRAGEARNQRQRTRCPALGRDAVVRIDAHKARACGTEPGAQVAHFARPRMAVAVGVVVREPINSLLRGERRRRVGRYALARVAGAVMRDTIPMDGHLDRRLARVVRIRLESPQREGRVAGERLALQQRAGRIRVGHSISFIGWQVEPPLCAARWGLRAFWGA